eukprot:gene8199-14133_t
MDEENGPKLLPESDYNPVEAKFCACLFWLVFHATEDGDFENIPPEITCPTERDPEGIFQVRPLVAEFLCTGSVYKKVCSQFFDEERRVDSMWDIIQELSYDGFYAVDSNDEAVTEERLTDLESFDVDAHLALVDAIMSAYINHSVNIQHIVKAVSAFASFSAAKELPFDLEDALLLWLNKINSTNERWIHKSKSVEPNANESPRRFRFKKDQVLEKPSNWFPKLDDLQTDVANGKALLSLVYFYCPDVLSLESMKLSIPLKQSDAICNIELFRELCAQHICTSVFALRTEDFIYKAPELKNNVIALLSEMFIKLELEKESDINVNKLEKINLQNSHTETNHYNALGKDAKEDSGCQQKIRTDKVQKLGPEDYDGIRNDTEPISSVKKASKFRDAENEEMSETNDIDSKDIYPLDNVETSIEDQLAKLKFLGSSSRGGLRKDVFDQAMDQTDKGKPPRSRQPLLSKRSRKQLATLGDEDRCLSADDLNDITTSVFTFGLVGASSGSKAASDMLLCLEFYLEEDDFYKNKDLQDTVLQLFKTVKWFRMVRADQVVNGMQLVDFDLKRSHSMTSVVGKANFTVDPSKSVRAWEGARNSDDASKSKSQKISLDFKPDSSAYRRQTQTASSHGSTKEDFSDDVNRPSSQRIYTRTSTYAKEPDDVLSCPDAFNDMHEKVKDFPSRESSIGNRLESSFAEDFRTELLKHTDQMKSTEPVGDFVEPQLEEDDYLIGTNFAKPAIHQVDQLNKHASPRPNKLFGINQNNLGVHDEALSEMKGEDHDDDLSTIAETSEPSTPTVYSFDTRRSFGDSEDSHTIESDSSRISLSDSQTSPTIPSGDITPLYSVTDTELSLAGAASQETLSNGDNQGSVDLHHSSSEQLLQNSFSRGQNAKSYDSEHRLEASDVIPRASYTIMNSEMSLESAKAAGLPIIDAESNFTHNSIRTSLHSRDEDDYKDINGQLVQRNDNVNTVTSGQNFSGTPYEHSKTFSVRGPDEQKTEEMYVRHFEQAENSRSREAKNGLAGSFANEVGNIRESSSFDAMDPDTPRIENEVVTRSSKFNSDGIDLHVDSQKKLNIDKLSGFTQANKTELKSTRSEKAEPVFEDQNFNDLKGSVGEFTNNIAGDSSHLFEDGQNEGEIIYANAIEGKDLNLTTTWSDVKNEKKGVTNRLLSPEDGKDPRISTVSNGPVTNWAQYAQSKATEDVIQSENEGNCV